jgi:hypothetical protein
VVTVVSIVEVTVLLTVVGGMVEVTVVVTGWVAVLVLVIVVVLVAAHAVANNTMHRAATVKIDQVPFFMFVSPFENLVVCHHLAQF